MVIITDMDSRMVMANPCCPPPTGRTKANGPRIASNTIGMIMLMR